MSTTTQHENVHELNGHADSPSHSPALGKRTGKSIQRRRGADPYDRALWRLRSQLGDAGAGVGVIGVTGCGPRTGVTTFASNLAIRSLDHLGGPVLLVDANFERPRAERALRLKRSPGLVETFAGEVSLAEAIQPTKTEGLHLLAAGKMGMIDRIGIEPDRIEGLVNELRESYSTVVIDLPEAMRLGPVVLLARLCDATLLVARAERSRRDEAEQTLQHLRVDGVNVVGSILNGQRNYVPHWVRRWL